MIESLPKEIMKKNKDRFTNVLMEAGERGTEKLLNWLEKETDFFEAPASTTFHTNMRGGLCQHSLNVLDAGIKLNEDYKLGLEKESIILVCLLHDLCKVNFYIEKEVWDKKWKDETNEWRKTTEWKVEDSFPVGHGEKSVFLALRYIKLSDEEIAAIRWHMHAYEAGIHFNYPSGFPFRTAMEKYPLSKLLIISDQIAEMTESLERK